ncbi:unnamed protein product [Caenorhabditis bovis]|uniref:Uncharacterized protein n=1 Tax=Caenorhabditis bovis TaxID=2654633 RepID=A0A8S1E888_9PELO|nr:unnamed protein product [Caenorhabditis bovis]
MSADSISVLIFQIYHYAFSLAGCCFSVFLTYLCLYHTPDAIKTFTVVSINFAITDFSICFSNFFVQQRLIPLGNTLAHIPYGLCNKISPYACHVWYSIHLHWYSHCLWGLLLSFVYRYYVLFHPTPTKKKMALLVASIYPISFFQLILYLFAYDDPDEVRQVLVKAHPDYDIEGRIVVGTLDIHRFPAMFTVLHMTLPVSVAYSTIIFFRTKTVSNLKKRGSQMSKSQRSKHAQLLWSLTYQSMIPTYYFIAVLSFVLGQFDIIRIPFLEFFTSSVALCIPVFCPMSSFCFVTPYRSYIANKVRSFLGIQTKDVASVNPSMVSTVNNAN